MFDSLTVHRSVENKDINMRPRYSVDIRYYESFNEKTKKIKVDSFFKLKKRLKNFLK